MTHASKSLEYSGSKSDVNCEALAQNVSEKKDFYMLLKVSPCDTLVMNVTAFSLTSKRST